VHARDERTILAIAAYAGNVRARLTRRADARRDGPFRLAVAPERRHVEAPDASLECGGDDRIERPFGRGAIGLLRQAPGPEGELRELDVGSTKLAGAQGFRGHCVTLVVFRHRPLS